SDRNTAQKRRESHTLIDEPGVRSHKQRYKQDRGAVLGPLPALTVFPEEQYRPQAPRKRRHILQKRDGGETVMKRYAQARDRRLVVAHQLHHSAVLNPAVRVEHRDEGGAYPDCDRCSEKQ